MQVLTSSWGLQREIRLSIQFPEAGDTLLSPAWAADVAAEGQWSPIGSVLHLSTLG